MKTECNKCETKQKQTLKIVQEKYQIVPKKPKNIAKDQ